MRGLLLLALLASASSPALAQRWNRGGDNPQAQTDAPSRGQWRERGGDAGQQQQQQREHRGWTPGAAGGGEPAMRRPWREQQLDAGPRSIAGERYRQDRAQPDGGWDRASRSQPLGNVTGAEGWRRPDVRSRDSVRINPYVGPRGDGSSGYTQRQWDRDRSGDWGRRYQQPEQRWSNEWRRNPRYDWRGYRNQNRFAYRVGPYYDAFGYGYRPLSVGFTLYSGYYQPNYWLDDPWQYRLPPVYRPYRWVRYWNDAVLVDVYTGEVVDVIREFFW